MPIKPSRVVRIAAGFVFSALLACAAQGGAIGTEAAFAKVRNSPPELYAFLLRMPKGADLHNHLSGAVYAETYLGLAVRQQDCVDLEHMSFADAVNGACRSNQLAAAKVATDGALESKLIDSLSMRDFVPGAQSAHDHFFATFDKVGAVSHAGPGELIADVVRRAAEQNESYLELMALTAGAAINDMGKQVGFDNDMDATRRKLVQAGLENAAAALRVHVDAFEKGRIAALGCDTNAASEPCHVQVRYVFQVLRESPPAQIFAQVLAGFYLASIDPRVAAVNFVQPEDGEISMRDYSLQMRMVAFARRLYPRVHVTLHAGELWNGLVRPDGLRFHIREAVEVALAERIGHGVDIGFENEAVQTLQDMHSRGIDVEINLTSNAQILGVSGKDHPFPLYRRYGVPVTLSTDDEGVERTHLTMEYLRAVQTYALSYADLKQIVRNSLEFSFLPGESYWTNWHYVRPVSPCVGGRSTSSCRDFLARSEKARAQADLEERFVKFEAQPLGTKVTMVP